MTFSSPSLVCRCQISEISLRRLSVPARKSHHVSPSATAEKIAARASGQISWTRRPHDRGNEPAHRLRRQMNRLKSDFSHHFAHWALSPTACRQPSKLARRRVQWMLQGYILRHVLNARGLCGRAVGWVYFLSVRLERLPTRATAEAILQDRTLLMLFLQLL